MLFPRARGGRRENRHPKTQSREKSRKGETRESLENLGMSQSGTSTPLHHGSSSKNTVSVMAHTQPSPWSPRSWFLLALSTKPNFQTLRAGSTAESLLLPPRLPYSILHRETGSPNKVTSSPGDHLSAHPFLSSLPFLKLCPVLLVTSPDSHSPGDLSGLPSD